MVPDEFRHLPEYRGVTGTSRECMGLSGRGGGGQGGGRPPQAQSELGWGPPPFLPSLSPFLSLLLQQGKEDSPLGAPSSLSGRLPLGPLYMGAGVTP